MEHKPLNLWNPNQVVPRKKVSKLRDYQRVKIQEDRSVPIHIKQIQIQTEALIRKYGTETEINEL